MLGTPFRALIMTSRNMNAKGVLLSGNQSPGKAW